MAITPGAIWEAKEVNDALLANLRGAAEAFLGAGEGFSSLVAIRHESPKSDLTKLIFKLKGPQDILLGASGIDNLAFAKSGGDFQGSLVIYKDRIYFASSLAFKLETKALAIKPEERKAELDKILSDLKSRVIKAGFQFSGNLDSFAVGKMTPFTKEGAIEFLAQVKAALSGLKLRAL
ncbi:MAG: hypothetical protein V1820_05900 [archaeon]